MLHATSHDFLGFVGRAWDLDLGTWLPGSSRTIFETRLPLCAPDIAMASMTAFVAPQLTQQAVVNAPLAQAAQQGRSDND